MMILLKGMDGDIRILHNYLKIYKVSWDHPRFGENCLIKLLIGKDHSEELYSSGSKTERNDIYETIIDEVAKADLSKVNIIDVRKLVEDYNDERIKRS